MKPRLPGVCRTCRRELVWNGHRWIDAGMRDGARRHSCLRTCGAWMPLAMERCARDRGHTTEHRTRYSMDNAMRAGRIA